MSGSVAPPATLAAFARRVLFGGTLEDKLTPPPPGFADPAPRGAAVAAATRPAREPRLAIVADPAAKRAERARCKVPSIEGMHDPAQRRRILHGLANHELQAIELFAFALLRFPATPAPFRRGLARILAEEQLHLRLYLERLAALGGRFGDEALSGYFWSKAADLDSPLRFVATMCLTFENANLDHALALEDAARRCGDVATAAVLRRVHDDEVGHVRFGYVWLRRFSPRGDAPVESWRRALCWPLRPALARGRSFSRESRRLAGLDDAFVGVLERAERPRALHRP